MMGATRTTMLSRASVFRDTEGKRCFNMHPLIIDADRARFLSVSADLGASLFPSDHDRSSNLSLHMSGNGASGSGLAGTSSRPKLTLRANREFDERY